MRAIQVEYTNEFEEWWAKLEESEQVSVAATVEALAEVGLALRYPHSSGIKNSRHNHMRELRIQHKGLPYRVLYAFDPRRAAILLLGGSKVGDDRWYERTIPRADDLYDEHLATLKEEK